MLSSFRSASYSLNRLQQIDTKRYISEGNCELTSCGLANKVISMTYTEYKQKFIDNDLTAEDIKILREMRGWTKTYLAEILGVSRMTVSHWENGTFIPSNESEIRLKHYLLDVEPNEIFRNTRRKEKGSLLDEIERLERNLKDARISSETDYGRIPEAVRRQAANIIASLKDIIISSIKAGGNH